MGLALMAPLFLAGIGLLLAPYIIHQIRRPEREPLKFSSLLFIPNMPQEVIERRRIQHILLMMLRMLVLLLLAMAFSRPVWKAPVAFEIGDGPAYHLVLLDTSYSMGDPERFRAAKDRALKILSNVDMGDRVGVVTFGQSPRLAAPLISITDPLVGTKDRARAAIQGAELTDESTAYVPALRQAHQLLVAASEGQEELGPRTIYVVSDFRKNGMPERHSGWKLPSGFNLTPVPVEPDTNPNYSILDVGVKVADNGDLRILAKVKNWSDTDAKQMNVSLFINGGEADKTTVSIKGGNASQVSFRKPRGNSETIEGYLELGPDALTVDNRRYFTWNPPRKKRVLILADDLGDRWPSGWFFSQALLNEGNLPWLTEQAKSVELDSVLGDPSRRPVVIIAAGLSALTPATASSLTSFVRDGGQVLLTLNQSLDAPGLNAMLLNELGLPSRGLAREIIHQRRFDLMSWVDLDHDVFMSFRGAKLNDFSMIRIYNHFVLQHDEANDSVKILARLDNDDVAIAEVHLGEGRMIVWSFPVQLEWTNLPKSPRFVPILHETLAYLTGLNKTTTGWHVGDSISSEAFVLDEKGVGFIELPGSDAPARIDLATLEDEGPRVFRHPGLFRAKADSEAAWRQVDAVNVIARESDPLSLSPAEFLLKMASNPSLPASEDSPEPLGTEMEASFVIEREYGRIFLLLLFALLVVENWYAHWLKR